MTRIFTDMLDWNGVRIQVQFTYTPGCPEQGPCYSSGGEPASPPEIEIHAARIVNDDDEHIAELQVSHWAKFLDYAYQDLCDAAEDMSGPDPDAEYERMRNDEMGGER